MTYDQPTPAPTRKVTAGAVASALAVVAFVILGRFQIALPDGLNELVTAVCGTLAAYLTRSGGTIIDDPEDLGPQTGES